MAHATRPSPVPMIGRALAILAAALLLALVVGPAASLAAPVRVPTVAHACGTPAPGSARCFALLRTDIARSARPFPATRFSASATPAIAPLYPSDLQTAYGLTSAAASTGTGRTVAVIDAFDDPTAESDLAAYRSTAGMPPCTTANGCFTKVDQNGGTSYPAPDPGWATEISLDLDMVSAICPRCSIMLVEADSTSMSDLGAAVNRAVTLGAKYVSNSYGTAGEYAAEVDWDGYWYNHPGVVVTASTGDSGYGVSYPAASQYVIAVGGTSLKPGAGGTWIQAAWTGAGSGCSAYEPKPSWQHDAGCAKRTLADVSAVADTATPVAVFDDGGWIAAAGTSASAPIVAAAYALAGVPTALSHPGSYPYLRGGLTDVTGGSNGSCGASASAATWYLCHGVAGYDGPTGLGTPTGTVPFSAPGVPGKATAVSGTPGAPGSATVEVSWTAPASDGGSAITGYTATSSPGSKTCAWTTGPLACTVTGLSTGQAYTFTVTATNTIGTGPASDASPPVMPVGPPGPPASVAGTRGDGQVGVLWSAPVSNGGSAITGYTVTSSPEGKTCAAPAPGTLGCTVSGLTNGQPYTFTVVASNTYGPGTASSPSAAVTPSTAPGAPAGVAGTPGNGAVTLTWSAPGSTGGAAITGYTATSSPEGKTCTSGTLGCTVSGLANGQPYTFTVTASNVAGTGSPSSPSASVTPRTVPGQPTNVIGIPGNTQAQISWSAPSSTGGSPVTGYTATASPGGKSCSPTTGELTCLITGLANGQPYTVGVTATNAAGSGLASSPSASVTPRAVPDAPTGVVAQAGNASATVTWTAPAWNGGAPITAYTVTSAPDGQTCSWTSGPLECTVAGLSDDQPYTFTVVATNAAGDGAASDPSAPATPIGLPGAPANVVAVADAPNYGAIRVTWDAPADGGSPLTSYTATAYDAGAFAAGALVASGQSCTVEGTPPATFCTIGGLTLGVPVIVRVTATSAVGTGLRSAPSALVAPPTPPIAAVSATLPTWSVVSPLALGLVGTPGTNAIGTYAVRYRRVAWNSWTWATLSAGTTPASSLQVALSPGYTYCFSAAATDVDGFVGPWSAERCTATPLDDRSLYRKGVWSTSTGSAYYRGTVIRSTSLGATAYRASVKAKRISIVVTTCPTCGSIKVYLGTTLLLSKSLVSSTTVNRKVITVAVFTSVRSGTVTVKVSTAGRKVLIDGLAISRN